MASVTFPITLELTEAGLWNTQLMLALSCARTKTVLRKPNRVVLCNVFQIVKFQAVQHGQPTVVAPYAASEHHHGDGDLLTGPPA